jgi:hypothetical protein
MSRSCTPRPTYFEIHKKTETPFNATSSTFRLIAKETISTADVCDGSAVSAEDNVLLDIYGTSPLQNSIIKTVGAEPTLELFTKGNMTTIVDVIQRFYRLPKGDDECICPQGLVVSGCSCYKMFNTKTTEATSGREANETCGSMASGGHLLGIKTLREMENIQHYLRSIWWKLTISSGWVFLGFETKNKVGIHFLLFA